MKKYRTVSGDLWDLISYQQLGDCKHMETLINANRDKVSTFIFKAGVELNIPEVVTTQVAKLPPWRQLPTTFR